MQLIASSYLHVFKLIRGSHFLSRSTPSTVIPHPRSPPQFRQPNNIKNRFLRVKILVIEGKSK